MDPIDAQLLNLLQIDSSRSLAELGRQVGLSVSAVNERLKKLRARGDVRAYVALINPLTLGYSTCAFVRVLVDGTKNERAFVQAVAKMAEIQECHHVAGEYPYWLKIWARDLPHLERLIAEQIQARPGVVRVETSIVLSSAKNPVTGLTARPEHPRS